MSLDLKGDKTGRVGYRAKDHAPLIEMAKVDAVYTWSAPPPAD